MLIKGVDLDKYLKVHPEPVVGAIMQFLEVFDCCRNMQQFLKERRERILKEARRKSIEDAEIAKKKRTAYFGGNPDRLKHMKKRTKQPDKKYGKVPDSTFDLFWITGVCPKCGEKMLGAPIPSCEHRKSGRVFYAECNNPRCAYYREVIEHKGDDKKPTFVETEGE